MATPASGEQTGATTRLLEQRILLGAPPKSWLAEIWAPFFTTL
jgi:hypothetical protein